MGAYLGVLELRLDTLEGKVAQLLVQFFKELFEVKYILCQINSN